VIAGGPGLYDSRDVAEWLQLAGQPIYPIPIPTTTASKVLLNRQCMVAGLVLRETTGTAAAQVELINGADASGEIIGELTLPAPLPGSVGNVDVDVDASSAGNSAINTVTLPGVAGATTFITGFEITGSGATAAALIQITITGILGGTKLYWIPVPAGSTVSITPLVVEFGRPIPASALNTAISVTVPSFGVGNGNAAATAHGFQRTVGSTATQTGVASSLSFPSPGVLCRSGLFMRVITGSVVGSAWVRM
jgi:hypothetical protein